MSPRLTLPLVFLAATVAFAQQPAPAPSDPAGNDAVSSLNTARQLLANGQPSAALAPADNAVNKAPNWIDAWLMRGDVHLAIAGPNSTLDALDEPVSSADYDLIARELNAAAADYEKAAELSRDGTQQRNLYVSAADLRARAATAEAVAKEMAAKDARRKATEAADQRRRQADDAKTVAEKAAREKEQAERSARLAYENELANADRARGSALTLSLVGSGLIGVGAALIYTGTNEAAGLGGVPHKNTLWTIGALSALAGGLSLAIASPFGLGNLGPTPPQSMWPKATSAEPVLTMNELLLGAGFGTLTDVVAVLGILALGGIDASSLPGALLRTVIVGILLALDAGLRPLSATFGANLANEHRRDRDFRRSLYLAMGVEGLAITSVALAFLLPQVQVPLFILGGLLHLAGVPTAIALGFHLDRDTYVLPAQPAPAIPAGSPPSAPGMRLSF